MAGADSCVAPRFCHLLPNANPLVFNRYEMFQEVDSMTFMHSDRTGFTLIELMVVVIIIAALAGMVLPRVLPASDEAKRNIAMGDIANISVGLKMYRLHNDRFPSTDEGLDALMAKPASARNWNGPYLERRAFDPWKGEYKYQYPGTHGMDFDLWTEGPESGRADDDVNNWSL
jgi:general secretion pathway protein G